MSDPAFSVDATMYDAAAAVIKARHARVEAEVNALITRLIVEGTERIRVVTPRTQPLPGEPEHEHIQDAWVALDLGPGAGAIANEMPEAEFLFEDTAAHEIEASGAALHFFAGGDEVFTRLVQHPGTTANQTMIDTLLHEQELDTAALAAYGEAYVVELHAALDAIALP